MSSITLGSNGCVYAMVSASLTDGAGSPLIKIGATSGNPHERARQLTASTSSPTPFYVAYSRSVNDVNAAEAAIHEILWERRVNDNREFFACTVEEACRAIDRVASGFTIKTPFADLFSTFPDDGEPRFLTNDERKQCTKLAVSL